MDRITKYNDLSEQIEKYWKQAKEIVDSKDVSKISELRLLVTLIRDFTIRLNTLKGEEL